MLNRKRMILLMIMTVVLLLALQCFLGRIARAHEADKFKHLKGSSGSIYGQKICDTGIQVWYQDEDEDGEIDTCTFNLAAHGLFHVYKVPARDGECYCEDLYDE